jgi:hypothetical protein
VFREGHESSDIGIRSMSGQPLPAGRAAYLNRRSTACDNRAMAICRTNPPSLRPRRGRAWVYWSATPARH